MKFTIGRKITAGFLIVVLLFSIAALYTFFMVKTIDSNYSELIDKRAKRAILAQGIESVELQKVASLREYVISGDKKNLDKISELEKTFVSKKSEIEKLIETTEGKNALSNLIAANENYSKLIERVKTLIENNQKDEVISTISGDGAKIVDSILTNSGAIITLTQKMLNDGSAEQTKNSNGLIRNIMVLIFITIIISILLSLYISRIISKPIILLSNVAKKIAQGDLTIESVSIKNKDEVGELASSFNTMLNNLRNVVRKVLSSSEEVAASAQELMAGSENVASASEEISASMQSVSTSIDYEKNSIFNISSTINEMSAGIEQTSANMQNVNNNTISMNKLSENSQESLKNIVRQMDIINKNSNDSVNSVKSLGEMSKNIEEIVKLITDISSQTNLLALNAAIEAARAGEHGRGFSVVADEVRKLAEQSNSATVEISTTIQKMNEEIKNVINVIESGASEVKAGGQIVNEVTSSFREISKGFEDILYQVQEVSASSQEMAASSQEVATSTDKISESVNKNALSIHEVAAAVEEQSATMEEITNNATALSKLAQELDETVRIFKIK